MYAIVMVGAFIAVPPNPDKITAPMDLVYGFRIISMSTITMFWIILGVIFGLLWEKLKPHERTEFKTA
ncbi:MAG TPA: CbtA family protein [Nitrososphaeraceae archaeon]|nr:CbtA family protein [Nitrososphaeraceae archaeon]